MSTKGVKWEKKPELLQWKSVAIEKQRFYYEFFRGRRWEIYEEPEYPYLQLKIGYSLFGPPVDVKDNVIDNFYNSAQKKRIEDVFKAVRKVNKERVIIIGFLFFVSIIDDKYTEFPVFRVLKRKQGDGTETCCFVDSLGYQYKNWNKFLYSNIIPCCIYCYPKDGFYTCNESGDLELDFSYSPQSYSLISGVVSAVGSVGGTVGSAVGTVLPVGRNTQQDLQPIPMISVVKGIRGQNKYYWIPVTSANGSADLYAVHCTQALAESSQTIKKIPLIISDSLDAGYINITWYAVLNEISNIIQHSNKTTNSHIAQVITSVLFFCHSVLSTDITKKIIKEIRTEKNNKMLHTLEHGKRIALKYSLQLTERNPSNPIIKALTFIDDRTGLINEIIENTFKTHFMIPDDDGNYFTLGNLLEKIANSTDPQKYTAIITKYCLVLENTIRNCRNCIQVMEKQNEYIGTFHHQFNSGKVEHEVNKMEKDESQTQQNNINTSFNQITTPENNIEVPLKEKENIESYSPASSKDSDENRMKNDWLLLGIINTLVSPLITPLQTLKQKQKERLCEKDTTESDCVPITPKRVRQIITEIQEKNVTRSFKKIGEEIATETPNKGSIIQTNRKEISDSNIISPKSYNGSCTTYEEDARKMTNAYDTNINTPETKKYKKNIIENIYSGTEEFDGFLNESTNDNNPMVIESKEEIIESSPDLEIQNNTMVDSEINKSSEETFSLENDFLNLKGKSFTVTRQHNPNIALDPLSYFKELVQKELNNAEPLECSSENDSWQFLMSTEVNGVKLVKISIKEITEEKEVITVNYY